MNSEAMQNTDRLPKPFVWAVIAVSIFPLLLSLLGADFGSVDSASIVPATLSSGSPEWIDAVHHALKGSFLHTILEWSAVCIASITVVLAFLHYAEKGEIANPILGTALFSAGVIDAFHILGADRLIRVAANSVNYTAFTWVVGRSAYAVLLILGGLIFMLNERALGEEERKRSTGVVLLAAIVLGGLAYAFVHVAATRIVLPEMIRPDVFLKRPWDVVPLGLFVVTGAFVLPTLYQWHRSVFTYALAVSMIPHALSQCHMAFGSAAMYDSHFYVAHALKIVGYGVPLIGLILDYRQTHALQVKADEERAGEFFVRKQAEEALQRDRHVLGILMSQSTDGVVLKDSSFRIIKVNRALSDLIGLGDPLDALGKTEDGLFDEDYAAASRAEDEEILATGAALSGKAHVLKTNDQRINVTTIKQPLRNTEGKVVGVVSIFRSSNS